MTAIILSTGPSLNPQTIELFHEHILYAVNDAYRLAPRADHLVAMDELWWDHHIDRVRAVSNSQFWTSSQPAAARYDLGSVKLPKPSLYHPGSSTVLAAYLAVKVHRHSVLVFLGLDLSDERGEHFFGPHPDGLRRRHKFHRDIEQFGRLHQHWLEKGVRAVNATPASALPHLPIMAPDEALKWLKTTEN